MSADMSYYIKLYKERNLDVEMLNKPYISVVQAEYALKLLLRGHDPAPLLGFKMYGTQVREIYYGILSGVDVSLYAKPEFSFMQMEVLRRGLEAGIDVSIFAKPDIHPLTMKKLLVMYWDYSDFIKEFKPDNLTKEQVIAYAKAQLFGAHSYNLFEQSYSLEQVKILTKCMLCGFDVKPMANPEFTPKQMTELMNGLGAGVDIRHYANPAFTASQMREIRFGLQGDKPVEAYAKPELSVKEMRELRGSCEMVHNIEFNPKYRIMTPNYYAYIAFLRIFKLSRDERLRNEIMLGIEQGVFPTDYEELRFDAYQMKEIRLGLLHKVDISWYAKPDYTAEQMMEIRKGLEEHLDVSIYRDIKLSCHHMYYIRKNLEKGVNLYDKVRKFKTMRMSTVCWAYRSGLDPFPYINENTDLTEIRKVIAKLNSGECNKMNLV